MRFGTRAGFLGGLLALVVSGAGVRAHSSGDAVGPVFGGTIAGAHVASFVIGAVFVLAGFLFLRRAWRGGGGLDPMASMLALGIAWVVLAISVPLRWMGLTPWKLVAAFVIAGTVASAAWLVKERWGEIAPRVQGRRGPVVAGVVAGVVFLVLFGFVTDMVQMVDVDPYAAGSVVTYHVPDGSFGPLAFWSVWGVWFPSASVMFQATFATVALMVALSGLVGVTVALLVADLTSQAAGLAGGAGVSVLATSFCAGCTPALFGALVAVLGSGAAPFLFVLGKPDMALYNVAQVGTVWLLAGSITLALTRGQDACALPPS